MFVITRLSHQLCPSYSSCNSSLSILEVTLKPSLAAAKAKAIAAAMTQWSWPAIAPICQTWANAGIGKIDNIDDIVINTRVII